MRQSRSKGRKILYDFSEELLRLAHMPTQITSVRIFEILRQAIVQMHILPGYVLSEGDIAKKFSVSRQPVREAFIKLADVGLVEVRRRKGTFVRLISMKEVDDARFLREVIEAELVRAAARLSKPEDIVNLRSVLSQQQELGQKNNYIQFFLCDEKFHKLLACIADRESAWPIIRNLKACVDRTCFLTLPSSEANQTIIRHHEDIITAIENHDPDQAETAMCCHLEEIQHFLPLLRKEHPDFFTD